MSRASGGPGAAATLAGGAKLPSCRACGEATAWVRPANPADPGGPASGSHGLAICGHCGSATTVGISDQGTVAGPATPEAGLYEGYFYAPTSGAIDRLLDPLRAIVDRDRARVCGAVAPGSRVLEIGCGDGSLLAGIRSRGTDIEVAGIEPSPSAADRAARRGVAIVGSEVESAEPGGGWDLIILWHALEHVGDPVAVLDRARRWLAEDGRLIVAVPNARGLQARIGGDRWFGQDVPRHLTHFTPEGLEQSLTRAGLSAVRRRDLMIDQGPLGMWQTLLNVLTRDRNVAFRALKRDPAALRSRRDIAISAIAGPLLAAPSILLELIAGLWGRGGGMAIEAEVRS